MHIITYGRSLYNTLATIVSHRGHQDMVDDIIEKMNKANQLPGESIVYFDLYPEDHTNGEVTLRDQFVAFLNAIDDERFRFTGQIKVTMVNDSDRDWKGLDLTITTIIEDGGRSHREIAFPFKGFTLIGERYQSQSLWFTIDECETYFGGFPTAGKRVDLIEFILRLCNPSAMRYTKTAYGRRSGTGRGSRSGTGRGRRGDSDVRQPIRRVEPTVAPHGHQNDLPRTSPRKLRMESNTERFSAYLFNTPQSSEEGVLELLQKLDRIMSPEKILYGIDITRIPEDKIESTIQSIVDALYRICDGRPPILLYVRIDDNIHPLTFVLWKSRTYQIATLLFQKANQREKVGVMLDDPDGIEFEPMSSRIAKHVMYIRTIMGGRLRKLEGIPFARWYSSYLYSDNTITRVTRDTFKSFIEEHGIPLAERINYVDAKNITYMLSPSYTGEE